jgi:two-component system, LytTR family, sensor histidine kinase AlgZ
MNTFIYKKRVLFLHLSFWCVYISFFVYQFSSRGREEFVLMEALLRSSVHVIFNMIAAYINYFIFLPRFLERKNFGRYILEFFIPFALIMASRVYVQRYLVDGYTHHIEYFYSTTFIVQASATTLFIVFFVGMLRFAKDWFEFEAKKKEIENERLTAELTFLKAQINPHFLFNTLNNLYYLAYSKSENTTEVIAKLSQMMRYMIYESDHPQVLLSKEIDYMRSYISLERLRLNNQIPIKFEVEGNPETHKIAPLILIPFLENAFKHGVSGNDPAAWVNLSIKLQGKECIYTVENSKIHSVNSDDRERSGIGLQNVKRRLELSYPGQHVLSINDQPNQFSIQLKLTLS